MILFFNIIVILNIATLWQLYFKVKHIHDQIINQQLIKNDIRL